MDSLILCVKQFKCLLCCWLVEETSRSNCCFHPLLDLAPLFKELCPLADDMTQRHRSLVLLYIQNESDTHAWRTAQSVPPKGQRSNSLQEKLKAAADANAVTSIAKEAGFSISTDDLVKVQTGVSDQELEGSAGGTRCTHNENLKVVCRLVLL